MELTQNDRTRLNSAKLDRLTAIFPQLAGLRMLVEGGTLHIYLPSNLVHFAGLTVGTSALNLWGDGKILYSAKLQSSNSECGENSMMIAEVSEKLTVVNDLVSWRAIAAKTQESEADIKRRCSLLSVSFQWMESGNWGISTQDAQALAYKYYVEMGEKVARSFGGGKDVEASPPASTIEAEPEAQPEPEPEPKKKRNSPTKQNINFVAEYKPIKDPKTSAKRYLAAIAPNPEDQAKILEMIVTDSNEARRHLNKALAQYPPEMKDATTRAKLQAAFTSLYDRAQNPPKKSTTSKKEPPPAIAQSEEEMTES